MRNDPDRNARGRGNIAGSGELCMLPPWSSSRLAGRSRSPGQFPSRLCGKDMESVERDAMLL